MSFSQTIKGSLHSPLLSLKLGVYTMIVSRNLVNIHWIWRQYKREEKGSAFDISQFNLNDLIKWLGKRQCVEVDDDLIF